MPSPAPLERSIYATVAWFSLFEYPVTIFEVWKWLWRPAGEVKMEDVYDALEKSAWLREHVVEDQGFWSLRKAPQKMERRHERFLDALRKYKKLQSALWYLSLIPTVRAVAAVNTLSWWHTRPESDIDLFVVARAGTVWLTRLLAVAPFALLKRRPQEHGRDPFCFSFFVSEDALALESLQISGGDPYLAMWVKSIVPVFDRGGFFDRFSGENVWPLQTFPYVSLSKPEGVAFSPRPATSPDQEKAMPRDWTLNILKFFEALARKIQEHRLPKQIIDLANKDSRVVLNDSMLKFHENDRREEFRKQFETLMRVCNATESPTSSFL